ncbi:MAG TPA: ABC transporter ATP-binding protein, partial [Dehalococcoidia bacterium]|nr:ABC transporter ATP-binding protein [Dehalococcoidia bacterium]
DDSLAVRRRIGYLPEDTPLYKDMTVLEYLEFICDVRDVPASSRRSRLKRVVEQCGIGDRLGALIGELSKGFRQRVGLAQAIVHEPEVLILDEPTSGLDPGNETRMMSLFRQLADEGHTLLLVTHATRNISLCDKVLFLTAGGRLAYFGTPRNALRYFNVQDFEDIYLLLEGKRTPEEWEEAFRASRYYEEEIAGPLAARLEPATTGERDKQPQEQPAPSEAQLPPQPAPPPGPVRQFLTLARRYAAILASDRKNMALLVLQAPVIAVLLWALFPRDVYAPLQGVTVLARQGGGFRPVQRDPNTGQLVNAPSAGELIAVQGPDCTRLAQGQGGLSGNCQTMAGNGNNRALQAAQLAFALAAVAVWLGTLNAVREIAKEDAIYRRERLVSLRVVPYVASKFLVLTVVVVFQSLLLLGVTALHVKFETRYLHWLLPFHPQGRNLIVDLPAGAIDGVWLSIFLAMLASVALALAISAAISNPDRALLAAPLVMIPQFLFAGGLVPVHDLGPAKPLSYVVATRWGYEAIGRVTNVVKLAAIPPQFPYADQLQGEAVGRWLALAAFVAVFGVLAVGLQRLKDRR